MSKMKEIAESLLASDDEVITDEQLHRERLSYKPVKPREDTVIWVSAGEAEDGTPQWRPADLSEIARGQFKPYLELVPDIEQTP